MTSNSHPIGARYLIKHFNLPMVGRLRAESFAGSSRKTKEENGFKIEIYPLAQAPAAEDIRGHFRFHLRYETPHFEFMCRFFEKIGPDFVQEWIKDEPLGIYTRRTAFFYEFFTGTETLNCPEAAMRVKYIPALEDQKILCASPEQIKKNTRWKILDNMPGNRFFCPSLVKNSVWEKANGLDLKAMLEKLETTFGEDMLLKAANWMSLKESRASFEIEHDTQNISRIERFARVLSHKTGKGDAPPLSENALKDLQREILGKNTVLPTLGLRKSPVFVGRDGYGAPEERVEYIAPPFEDIREMLEGVRLFLERTKGQNPIMRAAITAFGFVYIHPLADGNGRAHRFLIQDSLCRDGVLQQGFILPISAVIRADSMMRRHYDEVLDTLSAPLMQKIRPFITFSQKCRIYEDQIESDLEFTGNEMARPAWRYPKMEPHLGFLTHILQKSITDYLYSEAGFLQRLYKGREAIKEILEMPDPMADRILRAFRENPPKKFGKKLLKEIPALTEKNRASQIHEALTQVWKENPVANETSPDIFKP